MGPISQPAHALPSFATQGGLSDHKERARGLLNEAGQLVAHGVYQNPRAAREDLMVINVEYTRAGVSTKLLEVYKRGTL